MSESARPPLTVWLSNNNKCKWVSLCEMCNHFVLCTTFIVRRTAHQCITTTSISVQFSSVHWTVQKWFSFSLKNWTYEILFDLVTQLQTHCLLALQTHGIAKVATKKLLFRSLFVSCDFEIGIHFGDVELKWNGIKHAKVILIFERNYANMYQPYVMLLYVYAKSASHSYCTDTRHDDAMPCEYSKRMLWRHSNETCIELRVNDLTGKKPFG